MNQQRLTMPTILLFQKQERRHGHCKKINPKVSRKFLYPESPTLLLLLSTCFAVCIRKLLCYYFSPRCCYFFFSFLYYLALLEWNGRPPAGQEWNNLTMVLRDHMLLCNVSLKIIYRVRGVPEWKQEFGGQRVWVKSEMGGSHRQRERWE